MPVYKPTIFHRMQTVLMDRAEDTIQKSQGYPTRNNLIANQGLSGQGYSGHTTLIGYNGYTAAQQNPFTATASTMIFAAKPKQEKHYIVKEPVVQPKPRKYNHNIEDVIHDKKTVKLF